MTTKTSNFLLPARFDTQQKIMLFLLCAVAIWPWFSGPFVLHLAILSCLNILIVNGLAIVGRSGQLSFGHAAFVAIGAYVSVLLSTKLGLNIFVSGLAGILLAAGFAFLLGWVILRDNLRATQGGSDNAGGVGDLWLHDNVTRAETHEQRQPANQFF